MTALPAADMLSCLVAVVMARQYFRKLEAGSNMTPSFRCLPDGTIRPVYLYCVDASEFVVNKLIDRGSLSATTMVANVQDFITRVAGGLGLAAENAAG